MRIDSFDANLLAALEALLETRSVTMASQRLNLGVSATSHALSRLREHFDDQILVQVGREMVPTPYGQSLLEPTKSALQAVRQVSARPLPFVPEQSVRRFVVASADYLATTLLTPLSRRWAQDAPGLQLRQISANRDTWPELLRSGELDLIIWPQSQVLQEHMSMELMSERSVCVAWQGNSLLNGPLTREEFLDMHHVVVQVGSRRMSHWEDWILQHLGARRKIDVIADTFDAVPKFILGTNRIALMHENHARSIAQDVPLQILPDPLHIPPLQLVLQWHQARDLDPGSAWFRDELKQFAGRLGADPVPQI